MPCLLGSFFPTAFHLPFAAALALAGAALVGRSLAASRVRAALMALAGGAALVAAIALVAGSRGGGPRETAARIVPAPGVVARTDHGVAVPLGWPEDPEEPSDLPEGYEGRVIVAGRGDGTSNCHGWVFAGGCYWIPTECIDMILRDNGYDRVDEPRVGDLIVYRDDDGRPFHTGVVKAVGDRGFVLVESKWGQTDVFWHTPHDQAFGDDFEYWRADRPGHVLHLEGR